MRNFNFCEALANNTTADVYKSSLVKLLQMAHSGERAAANAYWGHYNSFFVLSKKEREEIREIYLSELHHRDRLKEILKTLGHQPNVFREALMFSIGFVIGFLCLFGGWFIPMNGAARLESTNMVEYESAARLALLAGYKELCNELLSFGEIEWDHELYFRENADSHWLSPFFPKLTQPPPRSSIQENFADFKKNH